ncbi:MULTISPECIES: NAD(P)/FAD-dependent oxidoreductase [unclassified Microbacterium]|uniref:FAD-dependent monooxygenase n=1 Tax=unclassified Microbacterium TaxID=2609290 RepID=UPI000C2C28F6|nr:MULTISPECIES: NAD(P)/FAD-dependent oxidoreductase [unclassified Microbacterium]
MNDVLIVGAGPVGVMLTAELARLGVEATVIEGRADRSAGTRAVGVHSAALTALEQSGATDRLLAAARRVRTGVALAQGRRLGTVHFDRLHSRHPYVATLPQHATEAALAATADAWDAPAVRRGLTAQRVSQRGPAVEVEIVDRAGRATVERSRIVVVATGSRGRTISPLTAAVRTKTYPDRYLMTDAPDTSRDGDSAVVRLEPDGVLESFPLPDGMRRYVAWVEEGGVEEGDAATDRLRAIVERRMGTASGADGIRAATAFGVRRSLVPAMRGGAVFAIGDAAHEVSPIGGQGMNLGLIDAATLAPLLALWVRDGVAPERELAGWERRRLAAAVLSGRIAAANTALGRAGGRATTRARRAAVGLALRGITGNMLTRAYAMGFDPASRTRS